MAYDLVEQGAKIAPKSGGFVGRTKEGWNDYSQDTTPHDIWRCCFCRALCVVRAGSSPPSVCGKCKR